MSDAITYEMPVHHNFADHNFKWSLPRTHRLISLVKNTPHIWNKQIEGYTSKSKERLKLFTSIGEAIGTTALEANKRFISLRERFSREKKKMHEEGIKSVWEFFEEMSFLSDVVKLRDKRKQISISKRRHVRRKCNQTQLVLLNNVHANETTQRSDDSEVYFTPLYGDRSNDDNSNSIKHVKLEEEIEIQEVDEFPIENVPVTMDMPHSSTHRTVPDESVEAAFNYFRVELNKMDKDKRDYCIDKLMMAFMNAKREYPK